MDVAAGRQRALRVLVGMLAGAALLRAWPLSASAPVEETCAAPSARHDDRWDTPQGRCDGALGPPRGAQRLMLGVPLDVNTADENDLVALPGVGHHLARRLVEYRAAHGPFQSVEALDDVHGVGPRLVERLRPLVVVVGGP